MTKKKQGRAAIATVTATFYDDGDATFAFDVNEAGKRPTGNTLKVLGVAKICSQLMGAVLESEAVPQIVELVERAVDHQECDIDD